MMNHEHEKCACKQNLLRKYNLLEIFMIQIDSFIIFYLQIERVFYTCHASNVKFNKSIFVSRTKTLVIKFV